VAGSQPLVACWTCTTRNAVSLDQLQGFGSWMSRTAMLDLGFEMELDQIFAALPKTAADAAVLPRPFPSEIRSLSGEVLRDSLA